ncbi:MAG TPA: putative beta-lysine N-acetyltransferase [Clostridiales bacterium]|nr:putative beta-lysine N-acetyltransferase [Clostridiales bacterium]
MADEILHLGESVLQHGKHGDRVYLMKFSPKDFPAIIGELYRLAEKYGYGKIFAKVPAWAKGEFEAAGYRCEARVPRLYDGREDACFMARFFDKKRELPRERDKAEEIIRLSQAAPPQKPGALPEAFACSVLTLADAPEMAAVYREVFPTYPYPIDDPAYIEETMADHAVYFGIKENGKLVALCAGEMEMESRFAEMTDFATLPPYRCQGFASYLLAEVEREMVKRGMLTVYTIARSLSYGMNLTFARHGYCYGGTLINNTQIGGSIESMNVWFKTL